MPRQSLTISTVRANERVRVDLKNRRSGVHAYAGLVTDVDSRAIRLRDVLRIASFGGENPHTTRVAGDVTVPWGSIQSVRVLEEATG